MCCFEASVQVVYLDIAIMGGGAIPMKGKIAGTEEVSRSITKSHRHMRNGEIQPQLGENLSPNLPPHPFCSKVMMTLFYDLISHWWPAWRNCHNLFTTCMDLFLWSAS